MNNLSNAERETILTMVADDRNRWHCFCDDPVMAARLDKLGAKRIREHLGGVEFELDAGQVLLRKGKKPVSDEARQKARERMATYNAGRNEGLKASNGETGTGDPQHSYAYSTTVAEQANRARLEGGENG